jgi:PX domain
MEYFTGDRFSNEFLEKRRIGLQSHLEKLARHPILRDSSVFLEFLKVENLVLGAVVDLLILCCSCRTRLGAAATICN